MCALSAAQKFWYKRLLLKDSALLARLETETNAQLAQQRAAEAAAEKAGKKGAKGTKLSRVLARLAGDAAKPGSQEWKKLQSLMMQLRKCCNHPFLFPNAESARRKFRGTPD